MNDPSQHKIDDELLSAYLDDELSADERALVETRLAADPAARHTLEQLRHVSQSVRDLPPEQVGRDLREAILTRAHSAKQDLASRGVPAPEKQIPTPHPAANATTSTTQLPPLTIARTPRAWFWASLAVAAALLIMFLRPGDDANNDLPPIVQNQRYTSDRHASGRQNAADSAHEPGGDVGGLAGAAPSPETRAPIEPTPMRRDLAESKAEAAATTASDYSRPSDLSDGSLIAQDGPAKLGLQSAEPPAAATAAVQPAAPAAPISKEPHGLPLIVNLLARPSAIQNKSFEKVLHKNGINFEPTSPHVDAEGALAHGESVTPSAARSNAAPADARATESQELEPAQEPQATPQDDSTAYVLVDAPSSTIFSCVSDLNKDADNFAAISVEPLSQSGPQPFGGAAPAQAPPANLKQFERGIVPPAKDVAKAHDYRFYNEAMTLDTLPEQQLRGGSGVGGGFGGGTDKNGPLGAEWSVERGRARRLQTLDLSGRESLERSSATATPELAKPASGDRAAGQRNQPQRFGYRAAPATPQSAEDDRMQVLFIIRPGEDQTTTLKAKIQPE